MRIIQFSFIFLLLSKTVTAQYIEFPLDTNKVIIDGMLQHSEWQNANEVIIVVNSIDNIHVKYKHDNTAMYFAFAGKLQSANAIFPEILTDGKNIRGNSWTSGQWWFHVSATNCENDGAYGIYNNCLQVQPDWTGGPNFTMNPPNTDTVEIRIPFTKVGFDISTDDTMGMAFIGVGVGSAAPKAWPTSANVNKPDSWGKATFSKYYTSVKKLSKRGISIYPNPARDLLYVDGVEKHDVLSVLDLTGKIMRSQQIHQKNKELDVSKLSQGVYILKISSKDGKQSQLFYKL